MKRFGLFAALVAGSLCFLCASAGAGTKKGKEGKPMNEKLEDVKASLAAFAPVKLDFDASGLADGDRQALRKLAAAAAVMDELFLRQVHHRNVEIREKLSRAKDAEGRLRYDFFQLNFGPWDTLRDNAPFWGGEKRPDGAAFYPVDMARAEFEAHLKAHPADEKAFQSNFTVIRREKGKLVAVPFSREYRPLLEKASALLKEAAATVGSPTLKRYLELRARDLLTDEYRESDMAWMDVTGTPIEAVVGPYEVYTDALFGYKAAYEAFVCVRNPGESAKLERLEQHLDALEKNLPLADKDKNFSRGKESPMLVVDEIAVGGDARPGVQTAAFNLPNDEQVREAKGSKKVMLRNVMQAKFEKILLPIADRVLTPSSRALVNFQSYFDEILLHEITHGLGPGKLTLQGRETTVSAELKDLYAAVEECKADIGGVWSLLYLMDNGVVPKSEAELENTYLAGLFRSVRFGIGEAHGLGVMLQYNFLKARGAIVHDASSGRFSIDHGKFRDGVKALAAAVLTLEANGDYEGAKRFIGEYGSMAKEVQTALDGLKSVPVDIRPTFPEI